MKDKPLIMVVDDEPANCKLVEKSLLSEFETITLTYLCYKKKV